MVDDGKPSENEPEDVALSLETCEMSVITQWIAKKKYQQSTNVLSLLVLNSCFSPLLKMSPFQMKLSRTGQGHLQLSLPWLQLLSAIRIHYTIHLAFSSRSSMKSKAVFLTICPVQPTLLFTMEFILSQEQQFLYHILKVYNLPSSQRQEAAASPVISISVACISSLCCTRSEFLTGEGTDTSRPALLQTTLGNLEKGRKKFWGPKFNLSVGHAEGESLLEGWRTQLSDFRKMVAVRNLWLLPALYCNYRLRKLVG